tara:strand:+ start:727 stop:954 length:228 start_codon:yes stop_codon:yes gene_type:complete
MTDPAILEREVFQWPESQRALLADRILTSLSTVPDSLREAWAKEADDRMTAFRDGRTDAVDGRQALDKLKAEFRW